MEMYLTVIFIIIIM